MDERLQEMNFGCWEGLPWADVPRDALDAWAANVWDFTPPGGESGRDLVARVTSFAGELRDGDTVITHGGPLKILIAVLQGTPIDLLAPPPACGSVTEIRRRQTAS